MSDPIPFDLDPRVEFGMRVSRFQIPTDDIVEQTLLWFVTIKRWPMMNRALEPMGLAFDPNSSDVLSSSIGLGTLFESGLRALGMYRACLIPQGRPLSATFSRSILFGSIAFPSSLYSRARSTEKESSTDGRVSAMTRPRIRIHRQKRLIKLKKNLNLKIRLYVR